MKSIIPEGEEKSPYKRAIAALKTVGIDNRRDAGFAFFFIEYCSEAQLQAIEKMGKFGWKATKLVDHTRSINEDERCVAVALGSADCSGWLYPNGVFKRAAVNKKIAYLDDDWFKQL